MRMYSFNMQAQLSNDVVGLKPDLSFQLHPYLEHVSSKATGETLRMHMLVSALEARLSQK